LRLFRRCAAFATIFIVRLWAEGPCLIHNAGPTIGSTRAALLAGIQHANAPVATNNKVVPTKVLRIIRVLHHATTPPRLLAPSSRLTSNPTRNPRRHPSAGPALITNLDHIGTFRTECHADADLMRLPRGRIGQHAINTHGDKNQAETSKDRHQQEPEARTGVQLLADAILQPRPETPAPTPASVAHTA